MILHPSRMRLARPVFLLTFLIAVAMSAASVSRAADDTAGAEKRKAAVAKGLAKLSERIRAAAQQKEPDIGFVAVRSFAGLAFLASGSTVEAGDYARDVNECLDQVLKAADAKTGVIRGTGQSPMYNHGFATLFLAEAYAKQPDGARKKEIGKALDRAVAATAKAQNTEGGWRYLPTPFDADVSVTAC